MLITRVMYIIFANVDIKTCRNWTKSRQRQLENEVMDRASGATVASGKGLSPIAVHSVSCEIPLGGHPIPKTIEAVSHWRCPMCEESADVTFAEMANIGTPQCSEHDCDMDLKGESIRAR